MRIASLVVASLLLTAACGGKSKAAQPTGGSSMENTGGDGGDAYGGSKGGYEGDKEPCDEAPSE